MGTKNGLLKILLTIDDEMSYSLATHTAAVFLT